MTQPSDANGSQNPERDMTDEELQEALRKLSAAYPRYLDSLAQEMRSWTDDDRGGVPDDTRGRAADDKRGEVPDEKRGWVQEFLESLEQDSRDRADENYGEVPGHRAPDNRREIPGHRAPDNRRGVPGHRAFDNRREVPGHRAFDNRREVPGHRAFDNRREIPGNGVPDNRRGVPGHRAFDNRREIPDHRARDGRREVPGHRAPDNRREIPGHRAPDNRGGDRSENSGEALGNPGEVSAYRVREPDGTRRSGGKEGHIWGPGRVLWSGEPSRGPRRGANTPEQPTVHQRREAAANAAQRRRDAERSERTGDDQGLGR